MTFDAPHRPPDAAPLLSPGFAARVLAEVDRVRRRRRIAAAGLLASCVAMFALAVTRVPSRHVPAPAQFDSTALAWNDLDLATDSTDDLDTVAPASESQLDDPGAAFFPDAAADGSSTDAVADVQP